MIRILDLCCGQGAVTVGYHLACRKLGLECRIVGVDNVRQNRYPFPYVFVLADALEYLEQHGSEYDFIHASPPCQGYSKTGRMPWVPEYPKLIEPLRELLIASGKPYVIENVVGAPMLNPILLCGEMFGLKVIRHRLFESNQSLIQPDHPDHGDAVTNSFRSHSSFENGATHISVAGHNFSRKDAVQAMQCCGWMSRDGIAEAVPPAYTQYIGEQIFPRLGV